ncbi:protein-tyrosine phosphatase [Williamsia limnetica]|jgi:protein-tyrosine phosphatase|uniref:protein-tyrosine-phosphatase n=1 Tax=Williamsia limnetica TaxID=882452 RepID=A0A318RJM4_WILLI|nr:low molecular weight protein-tyrosine-phosphatase [Williamsia limnetica]PYE15405.1 protein-tyrosine phosphatase [Williamsia limnetica]
MSEPLHVTFVCTGNICRSPMGQNIFRHALADAGLADQVRVSSCGTGDWHVGEGADVRARTELTSAGYDDDHVAAQLGSEHLSADLLLAMDTGHLTALRNAGVADRSALLRSFDPDADSDDVADPYFGSDADFTDVRTQIEAAMPGLLDWVRARL